jgi:hypothetical protein
MAVYHSTSQLRPLVSQLLANLVQRKIRRLNSIPAESHPGTCENEDHFFDCGAPATVTEVESERHYCLHHFLAITPNTELMKLETRGPEPLLKFNHDVLSSTKEEHS